MKITKIRLIILVCIILLLYIFLKRNSSQEYFTVTDSLCNASDCGTMCSQYGFRGHSFIKRGSNRFCQCKMRHDTVTKTVINSEVVGQPAVPEVVYQPAVSPVSAGLFNTKYNTLSTDSKAIINLVVNGTSPFTDNYINGLTPTGTSNPNILSSYIGEKLDNIVKLHTYINNKVNYDAYSDPNNSDAILLFNRLNTDTLALYNIYKSQSQSSRELIISMSKFFKTPINTDLLTLINSKYLNLIDEWITLDFTILKSPLITLYNNTTDSNVIGLINLLTDPNNDWIIKILGESNLSKRTKLIQDAVVGSAEIQAVAPQAEIPYQAETVELSVPNPGDLDRVSAILPIDDAALDLCTQIHTLTDAMGDSRKFNFDENNGNLFCGIMPVNGDTSSCPS